MSPNNRMVMVVMMMQIAMLVTMPAAAVMMVVNAGSRSSFCVVGDDVAFALFDIPSQQRLQKRRTLPQPQLQRLLERHSRGLRSAVLAVETGVVLRRAQQRGRGGGGGRENGRGFVRCGGGGGIRG